MRHAVSKRKSCSWKATIGCVFVTLSVSAVEAEVVTLTFQDGVAGYSGAVDTQLDESAPNTPLGTGPTITVDGNCGAPCSCSCRNDGLVRFEGILGAGQNQIAPGSTVVSAQLVVNVVPTGGDNITTRVHRVLV